MLFAQLNDGACRTYLLASRREAMLVDPVLAGVDRYLAEVARLGLGVRYVVDTHLHADHISGGAAIRDRTGADYVMHQDAPAPFANLRVAEGDGLRIGELVVGVLHTPGHSDDSISLVLPDRLLTGDFLLVGGSCAAPARAAGGDAEAHWYALRKLARLPDATMIYPAHDYQGRERSTLAEERRTNSRLHPRSRDAYVEHARSLPNFELDGPAAVVNRLGAPRVSVEALAEQLAHGARLLLLDVRELDEYAGELGHLAGARHVALADLERRLPELDGKQGEPLVVVCRTGGRSAIAATMLHLAGFDHARVLEGGMRRWAQLQLPVTRETRQHASTAVHPMHTGTAPPRAS